MAEPVLRISPKKYSGETTIVSVRLAKAMLKDIDAVAKATGRSRTDPITTTLEFALDHMEIIMKDRQQD